MWCNVATLNKGSQSVKMNHYLDTRLVGQAMIVDHDIYMQFKRWYDGKNLELFDQWTAGFITGNEPPMITDMCANAYGNYMCSNLLPNCTYMPYARWPYQEQFEKIYVCKEICEEVNKWCEKAWLPHEMRCDDLVSDKIDKALDPFMSEMSAYDRREAGGHACSTVLMTNYFQAGAATITPWTCTLLVIVLAMIQTWSVDLFD